MQIDELEQLDVKKRGKEDDEALSMTEIAKNYSEMASLLMESQMLFEEIRKGLIKRQDKGDRSFKNMIQDIASLETDVELFLDSEVITWT